MRERIELVGLAFVVDDHQIIGSDSDFGHTRGTYILSRTASLLTHIIHPAEGALEVFEKFSALFLCLREAARRQARDTKSVRPVVHGHP